jgi:hypothetical protein
MRGNACAQPIDQAVWHARLIGNDPPPINLVPGKLVVGYPVYQYLDIPSGFAVYPDRWYLD